MEKQNIITKLEVTMTNLQAVHMERPYNEPDSSRMSRIRCIGIKWWSP